MTDKCQIKGCDSDVYVRGLCQTHYSRLHTNGHFEFTSTPSEKYQAKYATWMKLKKRFPGGLGWTSFAHFQQTISPRPSIQHRLVKVDELRLIGPDNFQWDIRRPKRSRPAKHDRSTSEGRHAYMETLGSDYTRNANLKKLGLTIESYKELLTKQGGCCAICKRPETMTKGGKLVALSVDHDHETQQVRGLLCNACNRGIGLMKDSPSNLRAAAVYLEQSATTYLVNINYGDAKNVINFKE